MNKPRPGRSLLPELGRTTPRSLVAELQRLRYDVPCES